MLIKVFATKSYNELKLSSKFSIFQSEIMNDESLASLSKSSIKVFGKCTAEVTKKRLKIILKRFFYEKFDLMLFHNNLKITIQIFS